MSEREVRRAAVLAQVAAKEWTLGEAAERMELSYRQTKRLWKRYRKHGAAGLVHGSAGRRSNRAKPQKLRAKVLGLIRAQYSGEPGERFGPTLAAEHLASEKGIEIGAGTLRRWMLAAGLWSRERKVRAHRNRRARREHFGELVQMDSSFHQWLEERGPRGCLMNLVDDATGTTLCRLGEQETIWAAVGIQIIAARSPQAKGRVERNHGTHQDRLVKKLRRKKITAHAEVNRYLEEEYCDEHNRRFAVEARSEVDYHLPAPEGRKLREIFRLETERVLGNDWVVRYNNRFYQVERQSRNHAPAKRRVVVCEWEEGTVEIHYRGQKLRWHALEERPARPEAKEVKQRKHPTPPAAKMPDHPWRKRYQDMKPRPAPEWGVASDRVSGVSASAAP